MELGGRIKSYVTAIWRRNSRRDLHSRGRPGPIPFYYAAPALTRPRHEKRRNTSRNPTA